MNLDRLSHSDLEILRRNCLSVLNSNDRFLKICAEVKASYDPVKETYFRPEGIRFRTLRRNEIIQMICMFQFDEESFVKYFFLAELQTYLRKSKGLEDLVLLAKPETFFGMLMCSSRFNRRLMFSLLSESELHKTLSSLRLKVLYPKTSKPKRAVRHKGYRDHGSLPELGNPERRKGILEDVHMQEFQNQKEDYQERIQLYLDSHEAFLLNRGESEFNISKQKELQGGLYLCYRTKSN